MSSPTAPRARTFRWLKLLFVVGLVAWGVWCGRQLSQARRAGAALNAVLQRESLSSPGLPGAARSDAIAAAEHLGDGQFAEAARTLSPAVHLPSSQQDAAKRFLGRQKALRQRLLAAATAAEKRQRDGGDVTAVRAALARALEAAARGDESAVRSQLDAAEAVLDRSGAGGAAEAWPAGPAGIAARAAGLESAVRVGQELMTESFAAAGRLIGRAAWHCRNQQYDEAAGLLDLAAGLLGVSPAPSETRQMPGWFLDLAEAPPPAPDAARAQAAVQLAEAVARAETPGPTVTALVDKARREFDAGRVAEADWWASVALAALAMDPAAAESAADEAAAGSAGKAGRSPAGAGEQEEASEL